MLKKKFQSIISPFMNLNTPCRQIGYRLVLNAFLRKFLLFSILTSALIFTGAAMCTANPFTQKKTIPKNPGIENPTPAQPAVQKKTDSKPGLMERLILFQKIIREKMTALIRQAKTTGRTGPLLWVLAAAFAYGLVHSAGPGHGKALALSYIAAVRPTLPRALAFGNILAASHGLSGLLLVLGVKFILNVSISGSLVSVTRITQLTSYVLIIILGLFLFLRKLPVWKNQGNELAKGLLTSNRELTASVAPAVFIGMIPCPGVVLAVLFCLSMDMTGFGIILAIAVTLGMSVTLSAVVLAAMAGKSLILTTLSRKPEFLHHAADVVEALAGLALAVISFLLFLTGFNP